LTLKTRICASSDCKKVFIPENGNQRYCCRRCCERELKRRQRALKKRKNLCMYCGEPINIVSKQKNRKKVNYCQKCREYYLNRYYEKIN
jgi:hypothetical protein